MTTLRFFTRLALFLFIVPAVTAQVQVSVSTRSPMPSELSVWERDRSLVQVSITSPAGTPGHAGARLSFVIRHLETGEVVASSNDAHPQAPRLNIPPGPARLVRYGPDVIARAAVSLNPRYRDMARATNSLPEGRYEFCVRLIDGAGNEIAATGSMCGRFTVSLPDPPELLQPANASTVPPAAPPRFNWTPAMPEPGTQVRYRLRIVPVYGSQNREAAIERNTPVIERTVIAPFYQYSPADPSLKGYATAAGFAWQVALMGTGERPLAQSEVFTFSLASEDTRRNDAGMVKNTGTEVQAGAADDASTDDCRYRYGFKICTRETIAPLNPRNAAITNNSNPAAAGAAIKAGALVITGTAPGTTTITVEFDSYDHLHRLRRCLLVITVTVKDCGSGTTPGGTENSQSPPSGGTGTLSSGSPYRIHDSFFDVTYDPELPFTNRGTGDTPLLSARAVDCSRIIASRGTAATGGMIIHGKAGSVAPGATVTITDQNGKTVTVTADKDGSFTVKESNLPEGFDHTPGHVLRVSDGGSICTVTIDR